MKNNEQPDDYDTAQAAIEQAERHAREWQAGIPLKVQLVFVAIDLTLAWLALVYG